MALNIKKPETERLAQELAEETGETLTEAVTVALRQRLDAVRRARYSVRVHVDVEELQAAIAALPDRDPRSPNEILGYDEFGLPS
jgi:antitoxin VapB